MRSKKREVRRIKKKKINNFSNEVERGNGGVMKDTLLLDEEPHVVARSCSFQISCLAESLVTSSAASNRSIDIFVSSNNLLLLYLFLFSLIFFL